MLHARFLAAAATCALTFGARAAPVELRNATSSLSLSDDGRVISLRDVAADRELSAGRAPFFAVSIRGATYYPSRVSLQGRSLSVTFGVSGVQAQFEVLTREHCFLFALRSLRPAGSVARLTLGNLRIAGLPTVASALNACYDDTSAVVLMATSPAVECRASPPRSGSDRDDVSSRFVPAADDPRSGRLCGRFEARSARKAPDGWSVRGRGFAPPLDLRGCKGIGVWLNGDGKGELFKVQLYDGKGGYRDDYVKVDFTGWRYLELTTPAQDRVDYSHVARLNLYYNGIPAGTDVVCLVDRVAALGTLTGRPDGDPKAIVLEDFEDPDGEVYDKPGIALRAFAHDRYGLDGVGVGLLVSPRAELARAIQELERAAGLPSPHLSGVWGKLSPDVKQSYLFIQGFGESDVDDVIRYAKQGGFGMVLIGQGCWCKSLGHYPINTDKFPRGLDSLRDTIARFHAARIKAGLHFLAPSISRNDAYVTPVPDPRLVKDAFATLAADIDESATLVPTTDAPKGFPEEDGGYRGKGTIIQIGDELIQYGALSSEPPGFADCRRGLYGSRATSHRRGAKVAHLLRSYNYFLHDADTDLTDEVAKRVTDIANYCKVDMLYFDGSERLQGPHWYYNARIQKAYYDRLDNKDILLQGSSYSHYSWHIVSRHASADGQRDWKAYLDERLPRFAYYSRNLMPLDLGWYGIWSPQTRLDEVEYILQKSLGFDCSVSVQTNPTMLRTHPEMPQILRSVATYERLRRTRYFPDRIRKALREPGEEYRLRGDEGEWRFHPVTYGEPHRITDLDGKQNVLHIAREPGDERAALEVELRVGRMLRPGPAYQSPDALLLEDFENLAPYLGESANDIERFVIGPGKAGAVRQGVTQRFESVTENAVRGARCGKYTATSSLPSIGGWSSIGKKFDPPLDLSWHKAIGFWLRGDESGALFKLQLRDAQRATDYYIKVDYSGWRYHQLLRPKEDPIDYRAVRYLVFYYNAMPARRTCTCCIDDVKALRVADEVPLRAPYIELDGKRLTFPVELREGDILKWRSSGECRVVRVGQQATTPVEPRGQAAEMSGADELLTFGGEGERALARECFVRTAVEDAETL
ncbi:MAG: hypothetical protein ACE5O2_00260 [Armatimonadota bacterium]